MGLKALFLGNKAYRAHSKGNYEEAMKLYEEAMADGLDQPRFILGYTVLLLRSGQYEKARDLLVKAQKLPGLSPDMKTELFVDYAAAVFRLGDLDKGVNLLKRQHQHAPSGLIYQTLGYLLVEKYLPERMPDFDALEAAEAAAREAELAAAQDDSADAAPDGEAPAQAEEAAPAEEKPSAREQWAAGLAEAEAFEQEAVEYDDEDAVVLDNMGQFLYRVKGDPAAAKEWFDRAIALKPSQIDTLWFLSRYDLEAGDTAKAIERLELAAEGRFSPLNFANRAMIEDELKRLKG